MNKPKRGYPALFRDGLPNNNASAKQARLEDRIVRMLCKALGFLECYKRTGNPRDPYIHLLRRNKTELDKHYVDLRDFEELLPDAPMILDAQQINYVWEFRVWDMLTMASSAQKTLFEHYRRGYEAAKDLGRFKRFKGFEEFDDLPPRYGLIFPIYKAGKFILHNEHAGSEHGSFRFRGLTLEPFDEYLSRLETSWVRELDLARIGHDDFEDGDDVEPVEPAEPAKHVDPIWRGDFSDIEGTPADEPKPELSAEDLIMRDL